MAARRKLKGALILAFAALTGGTIIVGPQMAFNGMARRELESRGYKNVDLSMRLLPNGVEVHEPLYRRNFTATDAGGKPVSGAINGYWLLEPKIKVK